MSILFIVVLCLWVSLGQARAEFKNQFALYDTAKISLTDYVKVAQQFGYEWGIGDPWSGAKAKALTEAGIKVMYNSNNDRAAKWVRFNNPGPYDNTGFSEPTKVNIGNGNIDITDAIYQEMKTALCMTPAGVNMADNNLYDPATDTFKYRVYYPPNKNTIIFVPNLRSHAGVAAHVAGEMRNKQFHESAAGKPIYHGLHFDEVGFNENHVLENCSNPINSSSTPLTWNQGRFKFTKDLKTALTNAMAAKGITFGGMGGNVYAPENADPEITNPDYAFDILYNESAGGADCNTLSELSGNWPHGCGTHNTTTWGAVTPDQVMAVLAPTNRTNPPEAIYFQKNYLGAALIMGRAAGDGVWGGWYGGNDLTATYHITSTSLLRAIPTWDNLRNATSRNWNETTNTYTSSNSRIDPSIAWSRHKDYETNHKLFLTRNSGTPTITLNSNEKVVNAKCTSDRLFLETTDCVTGYFTQANNVVTLGANVDNGDGYVLFVHRQPSFLSAKVDTADQVDVCWQRDDAPTAMLPATSSTGWAVTVAGVSKTPASTDRFGTNCFRLTFAASTITSSAQAVTVAYSGGNVTSGTNMINGSTKVPAANFGAQTAQNTLGGGGGGTPLLLQTKFQWQNNVGTADGADLYGSLNGQLSPSPGGQARLIVKIRNTVNAHVPTSFPLYFAVDPGDPTDLASANTVMTDSCAVNPVCYTHAKEISSTVPASELLASDETTNVACGLVQNDNSVPFISLPGASEAECVYVIRFKETLTAGQRIYFHPRKQDGTLFSSYNTANLPRAIIADPRSDKIGGGMTGGTIQ